MLTTTAFTKNVYWFLLEQEYTHIYLQGVRGPLTGKNDAYYLIPLKENDERIADSSYNELVAALDDPATLELTTPQPFMNIMVEWTLGEHAAFLIACS